MEKVSKLTLVKEASSASGISAQDVSISVGAFFKTVQSHLKNGDVVPLPSIGILSVKMTKERKGHNPKTGEVITIKPSKKVSLKASTEIKKLLNE